MVVILMPYCCEVAAMGAVNLIRRPSSACWSKAIHLSQSDRTSEGVRGRDYPHQKTSRNPGEGGGRGGGFPTIRRLPGYGLLGFSWASLGSSWGFLGLSWLILGTSWRQRGAKRRPSKPTGSPREAKRAPTDLPREARGAKKT